MDSAENNVAALRSRRFLRKFVGVAAKIGEANDFIALVMVPQHDYLASEGQPSLSNTLVHGVVRKDEIVLQTANCRCRRQVVLAFSSRYGLTPTTALCLYLGTGLLKASSGSADSLRSLLKRGAQPAGML